MIDLRSDTVTHPTDAMYEAMRSAPLGDDVLGDDPTVIAFEKMAAERMGKEAALLVPSGSMANLIGVLGHCGRGKEVILGNKAHTFVYEAGCGEKRRTISGGRPQDVPPGHPPRHRTQRY